MTTLLIALVSFAIALVVGSIVTKVHFTTRVLKNSLSRTAHQELLNKHRNAYKKQMETLHNRAGQKITRLSQKIEEKDREIVRLLSDACEQESTQKTKMETPAQKLVEILRAETVTLREHLDARNTRIDELNSELRENRMQAQKYLKDLNTWKQRVEPLTRKLKEQQTTIQTFQADRDAEPEIAAPPVASAQDGNGANGGRLIDTVANETVATEATTTGSTADDLKAIRGIGPALEKRLNSCGIRRFHQIANMSEQELAKVASKLAISPLLVERGGWIEQARALQ